MTPYIASTSNPKIKWVKSLHKNSTRREEGVFLVEGVKEITYALDNGYLPHSLFVCPEIDSELEQGPTLQSAKLDLENGIYNVSKAVYEKISYRGNTDGIIAIFQAKFRSLDELNFNENPFFIIVESVEKPGNLGAILRTADGAGADGIIICDERTDVFNPNVIRSSVGTVFTKQVVAASGADVYDFLEKHEITAYGAIISDESSLYSGADFTSPIAIILGTEHEGLSDFWKARSKPLVIPMLGKNDSLNVSNAAAILSYEVVRQRNLVGSK